MPGTALSAPREMRFRWYRQVEVEGMTIPAVCGIFGISPKTYHKWYNRDHGYGDNTYRAKRDHPHTKLTPKIRLIVFKIKEQYNFGPQKMAIYLKANHDVSVSPTAIYKYFKRRHLIRKPQKKLPWYTPMKQPFVATRPGENVQADVKYVPGADHAWAYQFRFTDTVTNMQYAVDCLDKSATSTINAFQRAKRSFPFPITGIQTDNGGEFRGLFALYLKSRGIVHRFIPKRSAPWNGKVERANRSVDDEYYLNPHRPWQTLVGYTRWYNHERPHLGKNMNGLTPFEKWQQYLQKYPQSSPLKVY